MFSPKLVWSGLQLSGDAATETQNIRILHGMLHETYLSLGVPYIKDTRKINLDNVTYKMYKCPSM